jgi:hypothetical protein
VTDFKVGDKVRIKTFKNEEDYENQNNDMGWNFDDFYFYTQASRGIYTIKRINKDESIVIYESVVEYWPFQIEKVHSLKTRLQLIKELLK